MRETCGNLPHMRTTTTPLGEAVRRARRAAGLTQEQLAVAAGITAKTVRAVETGTTKPQRRVRDGLAQALGVVITDDHEPEAAMASTVCGTRNPHNSANVDREVTRAVVGASPKG